jgi:hypothetical protein
MKKFILFLTIILIEISFAQDKWFIFQTNF